MTTEHSVPFRNILALFLFLFGPSLYGADLEDSFKTPPDSTCASHPRVPAPSPSSTADRITGAGGASRWAGFLPTGRAGPRP